jgi:hypothetical protein
MENPNNPEYHGSPNIGANRSDSNTTNMLQSGYRELQDQIPSQQSQQQSQEQSQEPSLEDSYRHYFSAPNNSPNPNRSMTDEEEKAFYGYSNHPNVAPNVAPRNMTPAYAPRNTTPVYALAPASTPALTDNTPPRLWEMAKKYVRTIKNGGYRDNVYFYKDDDKKTSPMIGIVWDTSINPFKKTYEIRSAGGTFEVNKVYTPDVDKRKISGGGRLRKSKKMYKKQNLRKKSKSKSKRRHSHSHSRRH